MTYPESFCKEDINGVMFFRYMCLVFVFSEVGPKIAFWFVCNVNVERSEESSCHL
jgi:hypothetical protein